MIARVHGSILQGIDAIACEVEADVTHGGEGEIKLVGMAVRPVRTPHHSSSPAALIGRGKLAQAMRVDCARQLGPVPAAGKG